MNAEPQPAESEDRKLEGPTPLSERLISDLVEAVRQQLRKEAAARLRDVYLIGDIDKEQRAAHHRMAAGARQRQRQADHALHRQRGVTDRVVDREAVSHVATGTSR
jgi:hypothetical protein